jgi:hypothetical protein
MRCSTYLDVKQIAHAVDRSRLHGDSSMRETDMGVPGDSVREGLSSVAIELAVVGEK